MTATLPFYEVMEAVDRLTPDEQQELVDIFRRRLSALGRQRVIEDVIASRAEFKAGLPKRATVDEIMQAVLS